MSQAMITLCSLTQVGIIALAMYILVLTFAGLFGYRSQRTQSGNSCLRHFAVVIPARNEESAIANLLGSFRQQSYPSDLYDVYVVADSCTDRTAEIGRSSGATVYERKPRPDEAPRRSKAQALEFFFDGLEKDDLRYDAYVIMDADNVVESSFLKELDRCLSRGYEVVQGLRASKNPEGNWIARLDDAAEAVAFLEQRGRVQLGLSARLSGSAMAFSRTFLDTIGAWRPTCIDEVAELTALAAFHSLQIAWCPCAIAYDEKVSSVPQLSGQRHRWFIGGLEVFRRYFSRLLWRGMVDRDSRKVEQAFYMLRLQIPRNLLIAACALLLSLSLTGWFPEAILHWSVWAALLGTHLLCFVAALLVRRSSWRTHLALLLSPLFVLVYLRGILRTIFGVRMPIRTERGPLDETHGE